jgi:hypothetical protein
MRLIASYRLFVILTTEMSNRSKRVLAWSVCVLGALLLFWNYFEVKTEVRWLLSSRRYKSEVSSQPTPSNSEFKHIEWDAWGWGGQDTTAYLVFDPTDSLSLAASAHLSGKFAGVPCELFKVTRLEREWYVATFYTNEDWSNCN